MNEQDIKGAVYGAASDVKAKSEIVQTAIDGVAEKLTSGVAKAGDDASAAVRKLGDGAFDAYDRAAASARKLDETVAPMVHDRPYVALAVSAALGLVVGLLMSGRQRPRTA